MHYYKRNIGDYHKKAGRLNLLQHGVYTILMDAIYDREQFPTKEEAIDWCWASTPEEITAVEFVLAKFFVNGDGIYRQKRMQQEIEDYSEFCIQQTEKGKKGGRPKGTNKPNGLNKKPNGFENKPNDNPIEAELTLTTNHKPLTTNQLKDNVPTVHVKTQKSFPVPVQEIVNNWNDFAEINRLPKVVKITTVLRGQIKQRWADIPSMVQWDNFFDAVGGSYFLSGKAPPGNGRTSPFRATLLWITKETNFAKIAAGEYS